ncbi:35719_t:CDS:2 [Gigaspora margarita]|uniref:35719_t:CDS:1 n=1 Tax=Gigaspora margarita TaxID=4874 RepID=A0ABM8VY02_GIGMA|nr:35719_t:CDS:2 [Gigaspora margarita]
MAISIFKYSENEAVSVRLSGIDKNNKGWFAREMQQHDIQNYECLLSDVNIMKYMYQERQLKSALTILDEQSNFIGFIISKPEKKGRSEIVYALSYKYWNRGIGQSVLSKIVNKWGSKVRRIGLGENLNIQNKQKIQEIFQFNGKELEQFSATVRPKNVSSWCILKKVGFEPVLADVSIDFENKGYDLPPLDNLLNYCKKFEEFINKLNYTGDIEASKLYTQENDKNFTFCINADGRIRFHYKKNIK